MRIKVRKIIEVKQVWEAEIRPTTPIKLLMVLEREHQAGNGVFELYNQGGKLKIRRTLC